MQRTPMKMVRMARGTHLYRFPLDDKSTDFADLERATTSSAPASWAASQRSSFDEPSHVGDRVRQHRDEAALRVRLTTLGLLLLAAAMTAAVFVFAPQ